jgi:hypothetical protein
METITGAIVLKLIFIVAPLCSLLIAYKFFSKDSHDQEHFFHVFSVSYLAVLAFHGVFEIEIIKNNLILWLIVILLFLGSMMLIVKDLAKSKPNWNIFSHHHHKEFSYLLGGLFIFHSLVDGILFDGGGAIKGALIIHRVIDGFIIFDLIGGTDGGIRSYRFFRKKNIVKTLMMVLFICAPLVNVSSVPFVGIMRNAGLFLLGTLAVLDIQTEFLNRHGVPANRFFVAILFAVVLSVSVILIVH